LSDPLDYADGPEALVVGLARTGDKEAFAELVRRRQSWVRNLMRRCCGDTELADDLAQQVFLQAWRQISQLRKADGFGPWLKRLAITTWLQHARKKDLLSQADDFDDKDLPQQDGTDLTMDLDQALAKLASPVRLCVVLSYQQGLVHEEIAELTGLPVGTVKSHIRRGAQRLQQLLSAYLNTDASEESP